jgi:hypothetical protein
LWYSIGQERRGRTNALESPLRGWIPSVGVWPVLFCRGDAKLALPHPLQGRFPANSRCPALLFCAERLRLWHNAAGGKECTAGKREREQLACLSKTFFSRGRCRSGLWSTAFLLLMAGSALGQQNLLGNPGFETGTYKTESSYGVGYWYGDPGAFVGVENGITPYQGQRMFRALDISHGQSSDVHQLVDLSSYHSWISLGTETASWSARFNRIPGGPQTNTAFKLTLSAYDGSPSEFPDRTPLASTQQYFYADALADSWEFAKVDLSLPANTTWISTGMTWKAYNTPLVFDGHYVDDTRATVTPEPATLSLLALGGLAMLRRRGRK